MADKKPLSGRGGKREGSGRPTTFTKSKDVKVRIEEGDFNAIQKAGNNVPEYMRNATVERMKKDGIEREK